MDEAQPSESALSSLKPMPLGVRLTNAIVAPGEVFEYVKASPPETTNWVVPLILSMVLGALYVLVIFSQPAVIQHAKEARQKAFEQRVAQGKMTQQQADQAQASTEKLLTPTLIKTAATIGSFIASPIVFFLTVTIVWLIGRYALGTDFWYTRAMEVTGLSTMVSLLGVVVAMLLAVIFGNPSITPGPALLIPHFDPTNKVHLALSACNVFSIWWVAVLAIGVSKVSGTTFAKAAAWLYAIWIVIAFGPILLIPRG
jgi:hypothetical protein